MSKESAIRSEALKAGLPWIKDLFKIFKNAKRFFKIIGMSILICIGIAFTINLFISHDKNRRLSEIKDKSNFYFERLEKETAQQEDQKFKRAIHSLKDFKVLKNPMCQEKSYNDMKILNDTQQMEKNIINEIKKAKNHIHIEYFIIRNDKIGNKIKNILIQKEKEGVEVRIIYDKIGSFMLGKKYIKELENSGIEVAAFSPLPYNLYKFSINHRKILIIDGHTGIMGGRNIGDEYFGKRTKIGKWKDIDILIKGDSVKQLQAIFLKDWYICKGKALFDKKYYSSIETKEDIPIQIMMGEPDVDSNPLESFYLSSIHSSKNKIDIVTPYLIPTNRLMYALKSAALRGIEVQCIIPSKSDNKIAEYATNLYAKQLMKMGIQVYKYKEGFIHSKIMIKDGELSVIGTPNFDYRGLQLDYEVVAAIYDRKTTKKLENIFNDYLKKCTAFSLIEEKSFLDKIGIQIIKKIRYIL